MRRGRGIFVSLALVFSLVSLLTSQVFALDDIGFPIHPKAIPSSIVRRSGKGEGTNWVRVNFKTNAPFDQVVKFYREKTGRNVNISRLDSGKLQNTLILFAKSPQDQINVNISSKVGRGVTEVEITRNFVRP